MACDCEVRLPTAYATALRLEADGRSDQEIATVLGIAVEAMPSFMKLAHAKERAATPPGVGRPAPT